MERIEHAPFNSYPCICCGFWHVGHDPEQFASKERWKMLKNAAIGKKGNMVIVKITPARKNHRGLLGQLQFAAGGRREINRHEVPGRKKIVLA